MDAQAACRFFALPAELRKIIYGLAFSCSVSTEVELEHAESLAPSEVPLLCCRRFYKEAMGIWKEAARVFWFESVFTVNVAESQDHISATELSLAVFKHHVRCIKNIKITASLPGRPLDLLLESSRHEWNCWDVIPQRHPQDLPLPGRHFDTLVRDISDRRVEIRGGRRKCESLFHHGLAKHAYAQAAEKHFDGLKRENGGLSRTEWQFLDRMEERWVREGQEISKKVEETDLKRSDVAAVLEACYRVAGQ